MIEHPTGNRKILGSIPSGVEAFLFSQKKLFNIIGKLKRVHAPAKSVYQLQGELENTYMWEKENVLSYAARIKEIADSIEDAHRLNNNGQVDNTIKRNL